MLALSIRQPYAELILRGIKTAEYRSRPTRIVGQRFYIYAARSRTPVWSGELAAVPLPPWLADVAEGLRLFPDLLNDGPPTAGLPTAGPPTGVIVGTAVIDRCEPLPTGNWQPTTPLYTWHLSDVQRLKRPRKPRRHPQPVWFRPFG